MGGMHKHNEMHTFLEKNVYNFDEKIIDLALKLETILAMHSTRTIPTLPNIFCACNNNVRIYFIRHQDFDILY